MTKWLCVLAAVCTAYAGVVDEVPMFRLVDGKKQPFKHAAGTEYVAYYFSASWCPPCRKTTPPLVGEYQRMTDAGGTPVEIVLVGADRSEKEMLSYMEKYGMSWPAVEFGSEGMLEGYAAEGIPHLVLVERKSGKAIVQGTGPGEIEKAVEDIRGYSQVEGEFVIGSWMDRYGLLAAVLVCGAGILLLSKLRARREHR